MKRNELIEKVVNEENHWNKVNKLSKINCILDNIPKCNSLLQLSKKTMISYPMLLKYIEPLKVLGIIKVKQGNTGYEIIDKELFK